MENILTPKSCEIIDIVKETDKEWTFRIASDVVPEHGVFLDLSISYVVVYSFFFCFFVDG